VAAGVLGDRTALDADDVLQDAAISAVNGIGGYDSAKGSLEAWVATIIRRRALDSVRRRQHRDKLQDRMEVEAFSTSSAHTITAPDFSDDVVEAIDTHAYASEVLHLTSALIANPESFRRTSILMTRFDGNVAKAAPAMGLSADQLKDAKREFSRCGHVVARALDAKAAGKPVTVATLLGCLPTEGDITGGWATPITKAVVAAGGFHKVTAGHVAEVTGYALNSARQYLTEALHLMMVARTILEQP
jgi:RNA polymerase sigma-70 factor (ECF subfamily)